MEANNAAITRTRSTSSNVALGIIGGCMAGTVALISPFIIMQLRSPLPYMATPRRKVLAALQEISKRKRKAQTRNTIHLDPLQQPQAQPVKLKPLRYYDLGSGDGETVLAAASTQQWKATGIELNSTLYFISALRRIFSPSPIRNSSTFLLGDIWKQNISDADAVMIFGVKPLMPLIADKIASECRPGTFVMSYRFHVPLYSSVQGQVKVQKVNTDKTASGGRNGKGALGADLVYNLEEMRIYELRDDAKEKITEY